MITRQSTSATIKDVRVYRDTYCELDQNLIKTKIGRNWLKNKAKISSE